EPAREGAGGERRAAVAAPSSPSGPVRPAERFDPVPADLATDRRFPAARAMSTRSVVARVLRMRGVHGMLLLICATLLAAGAVLGTGVGAQALASPATV